MRIAERTFTGKAEKLLWLGGLSLALFYIALVLDGMLFQTIGGDGPSYLILAKSMVEGYGYADINMPGAPTHTQYPPFFPLLLAPIYLAFGYNFLVIKLLVAAFAIASLFAIRAYFSSQDGKLHGTLIAVLTGTNFFFLTGTNSLQTEIPFMFFSFLVLLYARKRVPEAKASRLFLVLPLLLALAYMTRMVGVTLVAASFVTVFLALRQREGLPAGFRKAVLFLVAASVPFALWTLRNSIYAQDVATYQSIFAQADYYSLDSGSAGLSSLFARFVLNSGYYLESVYEVILTFTHAGPGLVWAAVIAVFGLVMAGFVKELFYKREMKDFYFFFYMGLLTVWPVYGKADAHRYLVPLIPFLYHYLLTGLMLVWGLARTSRGTIALGSGAVLLASAAILAAMNLNGISYRSADSYGWDFEGLSRIFDGRAFRNVRSLGLDDLGVEGLRKSLPCIHNYLMAADSIKGSLKDGDVVMARKMEIAYLLLDKPVVRFPFTSNSGQMESFIKEKGVSHILLDACYAETEIYARKFVMSRPEKFSVLVSDGHGTVALKLLQ